MCVSQLCIFLMEIYWFLSIFYEEKTIVLIHFFIIIIISVQHAALLDLWLSHFKANRLLFKDLQHTPINKGHFTKQLIYVSKWSPSPQASLLSHTCGVVVYGEGGERNCWWRYVKECNCESLAAIRPRVLVLSLMGPTECECKKKNGISNLSASRGPADGFRRSTSRNTRCFPLSSSAACGCRADGRRDSGGFVSPAGPTTQQTWRVTLSVRFRFDLLLIGLTEDQPLFWSPWGAELPSWHLGDNKSITIVQTTVVARVVFWCFCWGQGFLKARVLRRGRKTLPVKIMFPVSQPDRLAQLTEALQIPNRRFYHLTFYGFYYPTACVNAWIQNLHVHIYHFKYLVNGIHSKEVAHLLAHGSLLCQ